MSKKEYADAFTSSHAHSRMGKYITIFILRRADSNVILRTDGDRLNTEVMKAGCNRDDRNGKFQRVVISKRKAIAPERRTGRALLRKFGIIDEKNCKINEDPCGKCVDCVLYGTAVGDSGAIKSSVISDEGFSILPIDQIQNKRTFNGLYENGTMINDEGKNAQSINSNHSVKPSSIFLDIETLDSVSEDEFLYVLGCILGTKRYGAITSRMGKVTNEVIAIASSNCELFSNLEWMQRTYDLICEKLKTPTDKIPEFPIDIKVASECSLKAIDQELIKVKGDVIIFKGDALTDILTKVGDLFGDDEKLKALLARIQSSF